MPTYVYRCAKCQKEMELLCKVAERPEQVPCEACGGEAPHCMKAPGLKDFPGSHRDEYTKTGPRF